MGAEEKRTLAEVLGRFKYVLLVAAVGLALLLWPTGGGGRELPQTEATEEARLAALLSKMEGVGRAEVLLSDSGAAVVCRGADNASVRLAVNDAVRCYTGLGADQIVIYKFSESWRDEP